MMVQHKGYTIKIINKQSGCLRCSDLKILQGIITKDNFDWYHFARLAGVHYYTQTCVISKHNVLHETRNNS